MRAAFLAAALLTAVPAAPAEAQDSMFLIEHGLRRPLSAENLQELEDRINRVIDGLPSPDFPRVLIGDPEPNAGRLAQQREWSDQTLAIMWGPNAGSATIDIGRSRAISALPAAARANRFSPVPAAISGDEASRWELSAYEAVILYALLVRSWEINRHLVGHLVPAVVRAVGRARQGRLGGPALHCLNQIMASTQEIRRKARLASVPRNLPPAIIVPRGCSTTPAH